MYKYHKVNCHKVIHHLNNWNFKQFEIAFLKKLNCMDRVHMSQDHRATTCKQFTLNHKSPKIPGIHLINPWGWKCQPNLEPSSGFETGGGSKSDSVFDDPLMCSNSIRSGYVVSECVEDIPLRCSRSSPTWVFHKKLFWCRNSTGTQLQWSIFFTGTHQDVGNEDNMQNIFYKFTSNICWNLMWTYFVRLTFSQKIKKNFTKIKDLLPSFVILHIRICPFI